MKDVTHRELAGPPWPGGRQGRADIVRHIGDQLNLHPLSPQLFRIGDVTLLGNGDDRMLWRIGADRAASPAVLRRWRVARHAGRTRP